MANFKFSYRYKDFTNYRKVNEVVFSNPHNRSLHEVEQVIKNHLIDGKWFYAAEWELPDLHFDNWDDSDHFLHEFLAIEQTQEHWLNSITIDDFLEIVQQANLHF